MELLHLRVFGIKPAAQGSKKAWAAKGKHGYTGKVSMREMNPRLAPYRESIAKVANEEMHSQSTILGQDTFPYSGAVRIQLFVYFTRPGKGAKCRECPCTRGTPDLDKVQRAVGDALVLAGVLSDDSQIIGWVAESLYVDGDPFTSITVRTAQV